MPSLGWRMGRVVAKDVEAVAVVEPGKALGWWRHKPQFWYASFLFTNFVIHKHILFI
ncbi:hypothetical protein Hanom_Chr14g01300281 [Helianthus anomalus]